MDGGDFKTSKVCSSVSCDMENSGRKGMVRLILWLVEMVEMSVGAGAAAMVGVVVEEL